MASCIRSIVPFSEILRDTMLQVDMPKTGPDRLQMASSATHFFFPILFFYSVISLSILTLSNFISFRFIISDPVPSHTQLPRQATSTNTFDRNHTVIGGRWRRDLASAASHPISTSMELCHAFVPLK